MDSPPPTVLALPSAGRGATKGFSGEFAKAAKDDRKFANYMGLDAAQCRWRRFTAITRRIHASSLLAALAALPSRRRFASGLPRDRPRPGRGRPGLRGRLPHRRGCAGLRRLRRPDRPRVRDGDAWRGETEERVEGRHERRLYAAPAGRSPLEVVRNYEDALAAAGWTSPSPVRAPTAAATRRWAAGSSGPRTAGSTRWAISAATPSPGSRTTTTSPPARPTAPGPRSTWPGTPSSASPRPSSARSSISTSSIPPPWRRG
jgi:hypothetical protein